MIKDEHEIDLTLDPGFTSLDVFIFCGGLGTRLRPYTLEVPKPLLKIGDYFTLYVICSSLKKLGFNSALVNYSYGEIFFKDASAVIKDKLDFNIRLFGESKPMGHAGALKSALPEIKTDKFLALNGDTLTVFRKDFMKDLVNQTNSRTPFSILAQPNSASRPLGYDEDQNLVSIGEMDYVKAELKGWTDSAGIYCFQKSVFDLVPDNEFFGFFGDDDIVERLEKVGKKVYIGVHETPILQYSVGTVEEYQNLLNNLELIEQFL